MFSDFIVFVFYQKTKCIHSSYVSGIAGGLLCLYAGVAYNELRSCSSIAYMYLCGAYPLAQVFSVLAIIAVVQTLIAFKTINLIKME